MQWMECSFSRPEENLAYEEVLLDAVEQGRREDTLRFWESPVPFVVLGTAQEYAREVYEDRCLEAGMPVLRRCSAGGCVLQGPGCLNFSVALRFENHPPAQTVRGSYAYLLGRICDQCLQRGVDARLEGVSDLAIAGAKVSGNAQRRRRHAFLHHGTLLYRPDYAGMARYIQEPKDRPDYRGPRDHQSFVGAIPMAPEDLRAVVRGAFSAQGPSGVPTEDEMAAMRILARDKYANPEWTKRR